MLIQDIFHIPTTIEIRNGEVCDRKWLVLFKTLFFCCTCESSLQKDWYKDWRYIGDRLKKHEISIKHMTNMNSWNGLRTRLIKHKTTNEELQHQSQRGENTASIIKNSCRCEISW